MNDKTVLDHAHAAMQADEDDENTRVKFYERLAEVELFVLLETEPAGTAITPQMLSIEGQEYAIVFDRDERLAEFAQKAVPYAALSGRAVVNLLADRNIGLGLNLGVAKSSFLMPAHAVDWLADVLQRRAAEKFEQPIEINPPTTCPKPVLRAINQKLELAIGMAAGAYLVKATYLSHQKSYLLGIIDPVPGATAALSQAINEAMMFLADETMVLDVAFFSSTDAIVSRLAAVGQRFDISQPKPAKSASLPPSSDPDVPPRLR